MEKFLDGANTEATGELEDDGTITLYAMFGLSY
jgi:hypothetical protein